METFQSTPAYNRDVIRSSKSRKTGGSVTNGDCSVKICCATQITPETTTRHVKLSLFPHSCR